MVVAVVEAVDVEATLEATVVAVIKHLQPPAVLTSTHSLMR
jgi:hypothetical protein